MQRLLLPVQCVKEFLVVDNLVYLFLSITLPHVSLEVGGAPLLVSEEFVRAAVLVLVVVLGNATLERVVSLEAHLFVPLVVEALPYVELVLITEHFSLKFIKN